MVGLSLLARVVGPYVSPESRMLAHDCMDNGMDPLHFLIGLVLGQNGVSSNHLTEAERIQNEDYNDWFGYSKIGFSSLCGQ